MVVTVDDQGSGQRWMLEKSWSKYIKITSTTAPGDLIHSTASGATCQVLKLLLIKNHSANTATLTIYDEDSNILLKHVMVSGSTMEDIDTNLIFSDKDVYATTNQSDDGIEIFMAGIED